MKELCIFRLCALLLLLNIEGEKTVIHSCYFVPIFCLMIVNVLISFTSWCDQFCTRSYLRVLNHMKELCIYVTCSHKRVLKSLGSMQAANKDTKDTHYVLHLTALQLTIASFKKNIFSDVGSI